MLLHGGLATAEMSWNTPLSLLAEDFQLVAPDTRAHGGTNHPGGELSYPQFADDLAALLTPSGSTGRCSSDTVTAARPHSSSASGTRAGPPVSC